ncbi:MAG: UPF0182 family protein [Candidatus Dormibacteraeota bacterium]|uniref:UPF0182 family protein n=1 Tax=Candidatus Aeolococcus gillhamiae TaxID=3127015 RepID=A0A2W5ZCQ4_9BACT|nr:UPF0182 family protein [Candidatus Dormibacteraeota bacterium]PZR83192.1 MAG: hypothetical protein DLM65_02460 [Candidatus Dormibacter sp. RRmetagenome_bin12]
MSAFGFDPEEILRRRRGPRVVRTGGGPPTRRRGRRIVGILVVAIIAVVALGRWLLGLRASYLYYASLNHTNVFWTPFLAQVVLFVIGAAITGGGVGLSIYGWVRAARNLDRYGGRIAFWAGIAVAVIAAIAGGGFLASHWQDVLLWLHGQSFGAQDAVFHEDYSFFVFTLPVLDAIQALLWAVALVGLLGAVGLAAFAFSVANAPTEVTLPVKPPEGRTFEDGFRVAVIHAGICLAGVFVLAALGAHFGVYHLATSQHDNFVGLDATQRNVTRPVLGVLQWVALALAVLTAALVVVRRNRGTGSTGAVFAGTLVGWLILAGVIQGVPGLIYQSASVNPNAQVAQTPSINDYLATSRYAWALQPSNVDVRSFGTVAAPTLNDLAADPGTLRNVRIQDTSQLPDTFAQIDRSRSYQTYPTITVDRYPSAPTVGTGDTEVMLGPREIAETDIPNKSFINSALNYTHGYGITAVSVNAVAAEGKPQVLVGQQPLKQVSPDAPPGLTFNGSTGDPRIYCGLKTTQPVVTGTQQSEFDYPSGGGDATFHAGTEMQGIPVSNVLDKLAVSVDSFGSLDLFLNNSLTDASRVLVHREITDRITSIAPFLHVDGDPYVVADASTGHLDYVADAYVQTDRFPESAVQNSVSYMRNAVKAVVDSRTCAVKLYAVDPNEPITAAWNGIYPGLLQPLDSMSASLRSHLRYPEDLFTAQAQVYANVHVSNASVFFNGSDRYRIAQQQISGQQQDTQPYYVEMTLPHDNQPSFVLFQAFSPASSSGGGANNMTAWLAAQSDYTSTNHPKLVAVPLNNSSNVLGPLQFDNNINTDPVISPEISLLSQHGSSVILGNVIVLPFNNDSFLYLRPLYVLASGSAGGTAFPQLHEVIVGTQNSVAQGPSFVQALQALFNTTQAIPGLGSAPTTPTTTTPPGTTTTPPSTTTFTAQQLALLNDLLTHEQNAQAALQKGDFTTFGKEEDAIKSDTAQLTALLKNSPSASASPRPTPSATP